ncbi:MAG: amidohydrolase family protein [Actinobacteria bacterium]|nr:amidohydrolase family protein [Actinomycetota bacterium]
MRSIAAARVLTPAGWLERRAVVVDGNGMIAAIEPVDDAPERILAPGFVDLQVNGIDDIDVATAVGDDWQRLDELLLRQGVTTWCPTLVTMALDEYDAPLHRIRDAMDRPPSPRPHLVGAHLEGPFLGGAHGAHRLELVVPLDLGWLDTLPDHVRVVTIGPEQSGAPQAIARLVARGVVVSLGHTRADEREFAAAVDAGATMVTHLFNAMSGAHHREPGVAVFAINEPRVGASIIADGVHVHPAVLRLAFGALRERAVLVTDAVAWRHGAVGPVALTMHDGAPRLADGTLVGSALTMDRAVRTCVGAGVELADALHAASTEPARRLGRADRGAIEVGRRADLVGLTHDLEVEQTWVGGEPTL